jgi:hypothetical protein
MVDDNNNNNNNYYYYNYYNYSSTNVAMNADADANPRADAKALMDALCQTHLLGV